MYVYKWARIPITVFFLMVILYFVFVERYKFLYADCFMDNAEFEKMFDLKLYKRVRYQLECEDAFPHVYDKISRRARTS
jgi:hypothetical protein